MAGSADTVKEFTAVEIQELSIDARPYVNLRRAFHLGHLIDDGALRYGLGLSVVPVNGWVWVEGEYSSWVCSPGGPTSRAATA